MKKITVTVRDEVAGSIIGLLVQEGCSELHLVTVPDSEPPAHVPRRVQRRTADGKTPTDILMDLMRQQGEIVMSEASKALKAAGFAENTGSATLSKLISDGVVSSGVDPVRATKIWRITPRL